MSESLNELFSIAEPPVKILIIDDNQDFCVGLEFLLKSDNVTLRAANDGERGLNMIAADKPDIVLLDIVMPILGGVETCRRIRQNPSNNSIYVVMLSSIKVETKQISDGLEAGADGYIIRPLPNRELLARLRGFIRIKRAEINLEIAEEKYRRLFNTMMNAYAHHQIITDDAGKPIDYRFIEVNTEFEKLTGKKASEIRGRSVLEVFPETESYWIEKYGEVALNGIEEKFINFSSALEKYFEVHAFSPAPGEFSTIFLDVTERELSREKMEKFNAELEKLNHDKDVFLSIIAHDLKSPFSGILGFSDMLKDNVAALSRDEIEFYATAIHRSANQTYRLLENLLHWTRIQRGKMPFNPQKLNLKAIADEVIEDSFASSSAKNLNLFNKLDSNLEVLADEEMLNTIFRNLLSNAWKFTSQGGSIELTSCLKPGFVEISVSDTGIGMSSELVNELLTSNELISPASDNNKGGTGIGLLLCKDFINRHGDSLRIESTPEKGSIFIFSIPLAASEQKFYTTL